MSTTLLLLGAFTAIAAAWDLETRRIPNGLVLVGLIAGLAVGTYTAGLPGLVHAVLGAAVGLGVLLYPWTRGWLGGGDVKLFAACGALVGWKGVLALMLVGTALHGFLTIGVLVLAKLRHKPETVAPFAPAVAAAALLLALLRPALLHTPY
jgi:prepilin peptidase CpaA